jgi:hypothetical protein
VFLTRIFSAFDLAKKDGTVTFNQFVVILWNYCTLENHMGNCPLL